MTSATSLLCVFAFVILVTSIFLATAIKIVPEDRRLYVYRLGRYIGEKGPGLVFLLPIIDRTTSTSPQSGTNTHQTSQFLIGAAGEASSFVEESGEVVINGITWNATSAQSIPPGTRVRVKKVIVEVEEINH